MSALPAVLVPPVLELLRQLGDPSEMQSARALGGGCINHALRLETRKRLYLVKWNADALPGMFEAEAHGLQALAQTHTVRVPVAYGFGEARQDQPAFLVLEWLEGNPRPGSQAALGEQLAELHRQGVSPRQPPAYGLEKNNYLGSTAQVNHWEADWVRFFGEYRLRPQMELAQQNHRLPPERGRKLARLVERLNDYLGGVRRQPSLIHGDLWSGNVIAGPDGLALIDPAVSYSDREAEMAYTELFGGFPAQFYLAYQAAWPLEPGYKERRDLYNLYHLLNHLNLFGETYGYQVDAVLRLYIG